MAYDHFFQGAVGLPADHYRPDAARLESGTLEGFGAL